MNDLLNFVNDSCRSAGLSNFLFDIKEVDGEIFGLINRRDEPRFWLPVHQLCVAQEKYIKAWFKLGKDS